MTRLAVPPITLSETDRTELCQLLASKKHWFFLLDK
jgi:hypothetical protein